MILLSSSILGQTADNKTDKDASAINSLTKALVKYGWWASSEGSYTTFASKTDACTFEYSMFARTRPSRGSGLPPGAPSFQEQTGIYTPGNTRVRDSKDVRNIALSNLDLDGVSTKDSRFRNIVEIIIPLKVPEDIKHSTTGLPLGVQRTTALFSVKKNGLDPTLAALRRSIKACFASGQ